MDTNHSNRPAILFVAIALGLSLLYYALFILHDHGLLAFDPSSDVLGAARGYGPSLAALIATLVISGRTGLKELWERIKMWRFPRWLFALAFFGPLLINLLLLSISALAGVDLILSTEGIPIPKLIIIFFFFAIVDGPVGEEIGWRGYLLPRLLERHGVIYASTLIGIVWFAWHLPLYIATDRFDMSLAFLFGYLLNNIAFSFLHSWFFVRSGGSALLAIIFHTAGNYFVFLSVKLFPAVDESSLTQPIYIGILVLAAFFAGFSLYRNPDYGQWKPTG